MTGEYPPMQGGVGDCTHELGKALLALGHEVTVVTSRKAVRSASSTRAAFSTGGVEPAPVQREPQVQPIVGTWNWASWAHVLFAMRVQESDVLHIQYQTAAYGMHPAVNFLPLRLRLYRNRPCIVVTFHDLRVPYLFPKAGAVRGWTNRLLARWSDGVVATNGEDWEQFQQARLPSLLRLIPIGSNIEPQPPPGYSRLTWRSRLGVGADTTLLCYFGFLNESKGGETLFRSLAELLRRGRNVMLLMIGGQVGDSDPTNVAYLEHVRALAAELAVQDHIIWTGYTSAQEVSANFLAADVCVLPYRDGVSYRRGSFMAALAHGLAIVSTQPKVPNKQLADGENILLVLRDQPSATADAVERLISTPGLRAQLGRNARELAKNFAWHRIAAQTVELYKQLLAQTRSRI